jgi:hypothetical protein
MNGNRSSPVLRGERRSNAALLPDPNPSRTSHMRNMETPLESDTDAVRERSGKPIVRGA